MNHRSTETDNAVRHTGPGHVESWFLRANHPSERKAIWVKSTIYAPVRGPALAEAWCALFMDGRTWATKTTLPLTEAQVHGDPPAVNIAGCQLDLVGRRASGTLARCRWDLRWTPHRTLGEGLTPFPSRRMLSAPFPKFKLTTPCPVAAFDGWLELDGERTDVSAWPGMQGHNWGSQHTWHYAWGQCVFPGADGEPHAMVEGFSGQIKVAGRETPHFSSLIVRRGDREYRFDRLFRRWRQHPRIGDLSWDLQVRGEAGTAAIAMRADPAEVACLGYRDPNGKLAYCLNSKLSHTTVHVNPVGEEGFRLHSEHGGALEILTRDADPRFDNPV